jgi:phage portal protein BeeE
MEWKPLELSEQDKAFLEYMEQNTRDIASMFAIPPSMIGAHKPHTQEQYDNALAGLLMELILDQDIEVQHGKATRA